jgi:N4-gp56 family major capsid protein
MASQLWVTNSLGGFMQSDQLSAVLRTAVQPLSKFRQLCDARDATAKGYGKELHSGDQYRWNVYGNVAQQGGTLVETTTMPETNFTITQGSLAITEYGNSVPYTGKLDNLAQHPVKEVIQKALRFDAGKAFDIAAHAQFNTTLLRVVPTAGTDTAAVTLTTNGTATLTNNVAMRSGHIKSISDLMKERNIPPYVENDYLCTSHPTTFRTFKNDIEAVHSYTDAGFRMILNGEIGRYEAMRLVEQSNIPKGGAADSTTWNASTQVADPWNNGLSSWAFFLGDDTVAEAIVVPEELRGKLPGDYGRSKGIAWYYLGGFGIVHNVTGAAQNRIVKWDSAA